MKKWKKFENKTKKIIEEFNPDSKVYGNVNIQGKFSKTSRQIDVQLVDSDGYDFMVFECKDKSHKVDTPVVEAFITKLQDLGAKKGAIVSNSPYTSGAQNIAEKFGIDLLHLVDSADEDINTAIYAKVLISDIMPKHFNVGFGLNSIRGAEFEDDVKKITLIDGNGNKITAYQVFINLWNHSDSLSKAPGSYNYTIPNDRDIKVQGINGECVAIQNLQFNYEVIEKHFLGEIKIINTSGIYNVKEKSYRTKSLHTEVITPYEVEKRWQEIESPKDAMREITFGMSIVSLYSEQ